MKILTPFLVVVVLAAIAFFGVEVLQLQLLFGVVIPYLCLALFVIGFIYRIVRWGRSAVPFRIPTTAGQEKSLPWIKANKLDNPSSKAGVFVRMLLEVLVFRSLFRNIKVEKHQDRLVFASAKWLWLGALAFHWSFLIILIRHLGLFMDPIAPFVQILQSGDSFLQIGLPALFITDVVVLTALSYLFLRRVVIPRIRYISLPADYLALLLLIAIVLSGILMRYGFKVDMLAVKEFALGLATFTPQVTEGIGAIFYVHLFLVSVLFAYFPLSKLMHAGGIFFSPTRNMANNNRAVRHVNPWNYPVKVHTYEEYEDDFREKMKKAGIPVDRSE
ncbi:MAG TPA: menaquinol oxidoreductase [Coriobacteriia bacterium]|nr:menaquinol oxidoreductase [Coriobacteriia bacterium]